MLKAALDSFGIYIEIFDNVLLCIFQKCLNCVWATKSINMSLQKLLKIIFKGFDNV